MHPVSEAVIHQILHSGAMPNHAPLPGASTRCTLEQIVRPRYHCGAYTGPERRAQGYLIAELVVDALVFESHLSGADSQH